MRVAIFPARGGSQRIPRKNIRDFMGKPMLQWPVEAAQASGVFDLLIVSTDDHEIAELARRLGCYVHWREPDDGAMGTQELAALVLRWPWLMACQEACVIYPCSPLLEPRHLQTARRCLVEAGDPPRPPYVMSAVGWKDAGCLYYGWVRAFLEGVPLEGNVHWLGAPGHFIDINTEEDWAKAESMYDTLHP